MKGAVTALLLVLPTLACAEGPATQEFSFFSSFIQMLAALSVVIGLILLTRHYTAKLSGAAGVARPARHIRLVETRFIAPKKSLLLVEVGGEYLLLASSEEGISLIKQVSVIEEIEVLEEPGSGKTELIGFLRKAVSKKG